jgi:hypothetical protein
MQKQQVLETIASNPETLTEILDLVREQLFEQWAASKDPSEREDLFCVSRGLTLVERQFYAAIERIRNP